MHGWAIPQNSRMVHEIWSDKNNLKTASFFQIMHKCCVWISKLVKITLKTLLIFFILWEYIIKGPDSLNWGKWGKIFRSLTMTFTLIRQCPILNLSYLFYILQCIQVSYSLINIFELSCKNRDRHTHTEPQMSSDTATVKNIYYRQL